MEKGKIKTIQLTIKNENQSKNLWAFSVTWNIWMVEIPAEDGGEKTKMFSLFLVIPVFHLKD